MPTENRSSNTEIVSMPEGFMLVERSIWTEQQVDAATSCITRLKGVPSMTDRDLAMAALDAAQCTAPDIALSDLLPAEQRQSEPMVSIPDGYCLMPRRLTAENGAKALLLGEFKLEVTRECPECLELEEPAEGCEICDGEGEYAQRHTIPWDKIKYIYSEAVKGLALQPNATRKPS